MYERRSETFTNRPLTPAKVAKFSFFSWKPYSHCKRNGVFKISILCTVPITASSVNFFSPRQKLHNFRFFDRKLTDIVRGTVYTKDVCAVPVTA